MKSFRLALIVVVSVITLVVSGLASADSFRGGGHGRDYRGGEHGWHYRDGGRHAYYRDWDRYGHGRSDFDVVIGGSWGWGPWWGYQWPYYYPYYPYYGYGSYYSYPYYYPPSVVVPEKPQSYSYIEREGPQSSQSSSKWPSDWFYCPQSRGYYPYVKECPGGWQTVPSSPPPGSGEVKQSGSSTSAGVWYYCPGSKTYYPYVKKCPGGWQAVPAKPPAGRER